jgi:tight adherence protein B
MFESIDTSRERLIVFAIWGLVFALWCGIGILWIIRREAHLRRLRRRIGLYEPILGATDSRVLRLWRDGGEAASALVPHENWFASWVTRMRRLPEDAGWDVPLGLVLSIAIAGVGLAFMMTWLVADSLLAASAVAAVCAGAFVIWTQHRVQRRRTLFERQFEDAMNLIARSLRAGQPLLGAFQLVAEEMDPPVSFVFHQICQQQSLGLSLDEAVRRIAATHRDPDLNLFATSIVIQLRTGGNLADMMQRLAKVIHERMKLMRHVRVLTAQTQYSKRVLLVLPVLMFVGLTAINPSYMEPLYTDPVGRLMAGAAIAGMVMGTWMMNRMAKVQL